MKDFRGGRRIRSIWRGGPGFSGVILLAGLLVLPGAALVRMAGFLDWRVLAGIPLAVSTLAYFAHGADRRRAEAGEWRIPECTLHTAELLGGWPGAFLAQRKFRHKTSKAAYQAVFWLIVGLHEFVALDSLLGWRFARRLIQLAACGDA